MSEFFEIAYAAASERLCLFVGTGFSKAVTNQEAPSWQELLESICGIVDGSGNLKSVLFPEDGNNPLSLEEAAQVISIELKNIGKNIHEEVATIVKTLTVKGDNTSMVGFLSKMSFRVITTNYDKLVEQLSGEQECHSLAPGLPIPRSKSRVSIYHIHGSVDSPKNMVVTSDDYFKFIDQESYFSRKLSTVLHEDTIVILGYSLGDTNLKAIMSNYKEFSRKHGISSNIFFISRSAVNKHVKDYYSHCYGIRVIDNRGINSFFQHLNDSIPRAMECKSLSIDCIKKVVYDKCEFNDEYLKLANSFFEIVSSIAAIGISINDIRVVAAMGKIIEKKIRFTNESGAWEQYVHLAKWLIYLATILELKGSPIEGVYLNATGYSMITMSREQYLGYSWHAYTSWNNQWENITPSNRALIRKYINEKVRTRDALVIVNGG